MIFGKKLEALRQALAATTDHLEAPGAPRSDLHDRRHDDRIEALRADIEHLRSDLQELRRLVHGALIDPASEQTQVRGIGPLLRDETEELPETDEWKQAREEQRLFVAAWNQLYADVCPIAEPPPEETKD